MIHMRPSVPGDVPRQRELWALAFGDSGDYIENFYQTCYRPERVLVLEEEGVLQSMAAWFDTTLAMPDGNRWKAGYLYAVATHPDARGRGLAGALLQYAGFYLKQAQCQAVTTVPAGPSLHSFFGAHGFRECFTHDQLVLESGPSQAGTACPFGLEAVDAQRYGDLREDILAGVPHIAYPAYALEYQAGCCRLSGGGLYLAQTGHGPALLCAEGTGGGNLMLKELIACPTAREQVLAFLPQLLPSFGGVYRTPGQAVPFGMIKWLYPGLEERWNWDSTAYLGLAFD